MAFWTIRSPPTTSRKTPTTRSAFFQAGEIGIQADRGEKSQHQGHLQRGIKLHFNVEQTQGQKQQSNHQASCNGFGDIVGTQKSDTRHESAS